MLGMDCLGKGGMIDLIQVLEHNTMKILGFFFIEEMC